MGSSDTWILCRCSRLIAEACGWQRRRRRAPTSSRHRAGNARRGTSLGQHVAPGFRLRSNAIMAASSAAASSTLAPAASRMIEDDRCVFERVIGGCACAGPSNCSAVRFDDIVTDVRSAASASVAWFGGGCCKRLQATQQLCHNAFRANFEGRGATTSQRQSISSVQLFIVGLVLDAHLDRAILGSRETMTSSFKHLDDLARVLHGLGLVAKVAVGERWVTARRTWFV